MKIIEMDNNIGIPARRALDSLCIDSIEDFNKFTRAQIADMHGIGPKSLGLIEKEMKRLQVKYRNESENVEVDEYIEGFPGEIKNKLKEIRGIIRGTIPEAKEKMAYGMPTYYYKENVVHFAGYKEHLGFYPTPAGITKYIKKLEQYKSSKGAIKFNIKDTLPRELIIEITKYRMKELEAE